MAQQVVLRAATTTPIFHRQLLHFLSLQPPTTTTITTALTSPHTFSLLPHQRHLHLQPPQALRPPQEQLDLLKQNRTNTKKKNKDDDDNNNNNNSKKIREEEEEEKNKRRNRSEMKREARQAVRWGMDLASFSTPQIKRILKVAKVEEEVFEALMLVKKLGSDVREGKRRQFNYIGKLLRDAAPDLLGALIQATKDGDQSRFQALVDSEKSVDKVPEEEFIESESESEQETEDSGDHDHIMLASKWFDGLTKKDIQTSNEVYSVDSVDFDRQELRRLVRNVHCMQDRQNSIEEDPVNSAKLMAANKSLNRFLCTLAKRHLSAQNFVV